MESLDHNGIIVLEPPEPRGIEIEVKGEKVELNAQQEQMAIAWAKKQGTDYVEDPVFVENFMKDFSKALGHNPPLDIEDVDFSPVIELVEEERARKESMTTEEKKEARKERKARREELKEQYGYAIVNGQKMELANYMTEPSGIFMGRGKHPLRGRWKKGASHEDITLNLSPDAEVPEGDWKDVVWKPDCIWIAKWKDKLTGKWKYVWLHDSTPIKQQREEEKFNTALKIGEKLDKIRAHINKGLHSDKAKTRMIAAACYLIDRLCLRVGDEKDPDEADTVGATTLRAEHVTFREDSIVFDFRGKDYVKWHKEIDVPENVYKVFKEIHDKAVKRIEEYEAGERKGPS
ncbi:MAG: DNA topoisomerase I, partial [Candidatus Thorarchaeota archaeon]|nr:DNA topoisomerase I [Candidatus Thorarchaeota archaeon]